MLEAAGIMGGGYVVVEGSEGNASSKVGSVSCG